jgi:hypothetical protein
LLVILLQCAGQTTGRRRVGRWSSSSTNLHLPRHSVIPNRSVWFFGTRSLFGSSQTGYRSVLENSRYRGISLSVLSVRFSKYRKYRTDREGANGAAMSGATAGGGELAEDEGVSMPCAVLEWSAVSRHQAGTRPHRGRTAVWERERDSVRDPTMAGRDELDATGGGH